MPQHLKAQYALTQSDLVEMSLDKDTMQDEYIERHGLTNTGWYIQDETGHRRLDKTDIEQTIKCLFQMRPTSRIVDIKPSEGTVREKNVVVKNTSVYKMTMLEKASVVAEEFLKDPKIQGFKYIIEGLDSEKTPPNVTISVYTVDETDDMDFVPCSIFIRWRKNF